jgi:trans-AT polyketide synthase, acyltransferase and oxidoreductase domains
MSKRAILFPGQGAQFRGMGKSLFPAYQDLSRRASDILGFSIQELCLEDSDKKLHLTQFTQPALYVVNAMGYYHWLADNGSPPHFLAGHSLGEYNALLAAGVFDFETGLKLVKKRGELMSRADGGGMAAVIGLNAQTIRQLLADHHLEDIDLANFNTPKQVVISGPVDSIAKAQKVLTKSDSRCVILNVSAPFHSRYMRASQKEFAAFLDGFAFRDPRVHVVANATARPYEAGNIAPTLADQIGSPVRWTDSIRYLMGQAVTNCLEIGGTILTKMVDEIVKTETPIIVPTNGSAASETAKAGAQETHIPESKAQLTPMLRDDKNKAGAQSPPIIPAMPEKPRPDPMVARTSIEEGRRPSMASSLGSPVFRQRYRTKFAYVTGSMYRGIASPQMVVRMGKAKLIGFFGTGGLTLQEIEDGLSYIQKSLPNGESYGSNLLANYENPDLELRTVQLLLKRGVRNIEAAAFVQPTPALVLFRLKGLRKDERGQPVCTHNIIAKVSRPEVAEVFMSPPPESIVRELAAQGSITAEEAGMAQAVPVSHDICVEADSGGHTDGAIPTVLLPPMLRLRDELSAKHGYREQLCMGLAGGIGTPEAAAAAFIMGADFILTGSINQCTVEAGTSPEVKALLQDINVQDTDYAPAGDMFEFGAKIQVLKKGVFFSTRANKLFNIYQNFSSLDELPENIKRTIEKTYFKKSFEDIWSETKVYLQKAEKNQELDRAEGDPKHRMALVFRWYFFYSSQLAMKGDPSDRVNYQIHTGPALGAFNQWVKGTSLESWTRRHADEIGELLMDKTAQYIQHRMRKFAEVSMHETSQPPLQPQ